MANNQQTLISDYFSDTKVHMFSCKLQMQIVLKDLDILSKEKNVTTFEINRCYSKLQFKLDKDRFTMLQSCEDIYNQSTSALKTRLFFLHEQIKHVKSLQTEALIPRSGSYLEFSQEYEILRLNFSTFMNSQFRDVSCSRFPICKYFANTSIVERSFDIAGFLLTEETIHATSSYSLPSINILSPPSLITISDSFIYILVRNNFECRNIIYIFNRNWVFSSKINVSHCFIHDTNIDVSGLATNFHSLFVAVPSENTICSFFLSGELENLITNDGTASAHSNLYLPNDVATSKSGHLIIADSGNDRIIVYTSDLCCSHQFGGFFSKHNLLKFPEKVSVNSNNVIMVKHRGYPPINFYNFYGILLGQCILFGSTISALIANKSGTNSQLFMIGNCSQSKLALYSFGDRKLIKFSVFGNGLKPLKEPEGGVISHEGKLYVCDTGHNAIEIYQTIEEYHLYRV